MLRSRAWVVCASHRGDLERIAGMMENQTWENYTLVYVANGAGLGRYYADSLRCKVLRCSGGLVSSLNLGLRYVRSSVGLRSDDWIFKVDGDDDYGPDYLERTMLAGARGAHACGRTHVWVRNQAGRLWDLDYGDINANSPHGPTLAARADCFLDFIVQPCPWGEDTAWWLSMRAAGVEFTDVGRDGFCWHRYADPRHKHTYPFADNEMRDTAVGGVRDFGAYDRRVVLGEVPAPVGTPVAPQPLDFAAYEAAINKTINEVSYG